MNKARRKELARIQGELSTALDTLNGLKADLENVRDEEQDYLDNMPESLQQSERGEMAQQAVSNLDQVIDALDGLLDEDIDGLLDEAAS